MPFGVAYAPALFQEPMNKILCILRCRPFVPELVSRGAEMEAHIDDLSLGTNTEEDHILLLQEFFIVSHENHLRIKHAKCEFMREEIWTLGMADRSEPHVRCNPCSTCRYAMTLRRVPRTFGVSLARPIFIGAIYPALQIHQPPWLTL